MRVQLLHLFHPAAHEDKYPKPLNQKTIPHQGLYQAINLPYHHISSLTQTAHLLPGQFVRDQYGREGYEQRLNEYSVCHCRR